MTMAVRALNRAGIGRGRRIGQASKWKFRPETLFAAGAPGLAYDFNDYYTLFQDSAGTTPVTAAGQPVGLVLDKSKGLVLGPEKYSFAAVGAPAGSGVITQTSSGYTFNGVGQASGDAGQRSYINLSTVAGKTYKVTLSLSGADFLGTSGNGVFARSDLNGTGPVLVTLASITNGAVNFVFNATAAVSSILLDSNKDNSSYSVSNISVRELPGNHAVQATAASRPILRQSPILGPELVSNGTFDADTSGWVGDGNTTLSFVSGRLRGTRSGAGNPRASAAISGLVIGRTYEVTMDLLRGPAMGANIFLRAALSSSLSDTAYLNKGHTSSAYGSKATFVAVATTMYVGAVAETTAVDQYFEIDNASVREITGYYTDRNYLEFDGVDDFLQTNSIDFSSTDKVSVFAGVRKLSDAAVRFICGNANSATQNQTFSLFAPVSSTNAIYGARLRSTDVESQATSVVSSAPDNAVLLGVLDFSGINKAVLRRNGVLEGSSASNAGSGPFGNYPLYIGRRGGTSLPFNGHLYSLVIVGKLASDSEISNTERYIAQRTGVTLP